MNISKEDYLRVMYELYEIDKDGIKSINIATKLNVSKPSVSEMLRKLQSEKLIQARPYSKIKLKDKGLKEARRIMHSHRVIEVFLRKVLDYDINKLHEEAHRLEHAFSDESLRRLDKFQDNPKKSPHGRIIPH